MKGPPPARMPSLTARVVLTVCPGDVCPLTDVLIGMAIEIIIADDHRLVIEGLKALIAKAPDIALLAEANDGRSAVSLTRKLHPNVVVMDITMPGLNGVDATRKIVAHVPDTKILALSMHSHIQFVQSMLQAGATGYLLKDCAFSELEKAIRTVAAGEVYLSPEINSKVLRDLILGLRRPVQESQRVLTLREREVLQLVAEGRTTIEVAEILNVSVKTVETHRRQIMKKLQVHGVAELTKYAIREGLTSL